jgi:hypothetical protein
MFARSAGKRCVTSRQEYEMIQVGARQAQCPLILNQGDPGTAAQLLAALTAGGWRGGDKDF